LQQISVAAAAAAFSASNQISPSNLFSDQYSMPNPILSMFQAMSGFNNSSP